ncbi:hypothetical protein C8Q78DRAFT_421422 [Trametes maxima]|nr:hypothetical protein C8Q78DRAFT_421422 [Trametes maxima]
MLIGIAFRRCLVRYPALSTTTESWMATAPSTSQGGSTSPSGTTQAPLSPLSLGLPSVGSTLGAVYIGIMLGALLYGLTVHQTYRYFKLYPSDKIYIKILVVTIFVLETAHSLLWYIIGYHYLGYTISDALKGAPGLLPGHWSERAIGLTTVLSVLACETFYAFRIYLIGRSYKWLMVPTVLVMFVAFGFGIAAGVETTMLSSTYIVELEHLESPAPVQEDSVLRVLTIYTVNTGLLTSVFSTATFVFAVILPGNFIYACISIVGSKLYANSVLAVLNSRKSINNRFVDDFTSLGIRDSMPLPGLSRHITPGDTEPTIENPLV